MAWTEIQNSHAVSVLILAMGGQTHSKPCTGLTNVVPPNSHYFILTLKEDKVKVVNAGSAELKLVARLVKKHCRVVKEGWAKYLTYSYSVRESGRHCMIQLVADTLLCLYKTGWQPMTPIEVGIQKPEKHQTAVCFRRLRDTSEAGSSEYKDRASEEDSCLCLETYDDTYLGLHNVSNQVVLDIVMTIQQHWSPGIQGVSTGVVSVISDYCHNTPPTLPQYSASHTLKIIKLSGRPWAVHAQEGKDLEDTISAENLQVSIVACLSKQGYTLGMDINMDTTSRVFFFIKSVTDHSAEVRVPNNAGAGLGEKNTLSVYRPLVLRHRSSFFRSYNGKNFALHRKVQASLRRKTMARKDVQSSNRQTEWWQQTSTDNSDYEDIE